MFNDQSQDSRTSSEEAMSFLSPAPAQAAIIAGRADQTNSLSTPDPKPKALIDSLEPGPYDLATLFPHVNGRGAAGDVADRIIMLRSVELRLETLLYPDERIEFVTRGKFNSFAELMVMGWWIASALNRTLLIFTNYRVLLLNSDHKGRARRLMWQIPYDQIRKFRTGALSSSIAFTLKDRSRFTFSSIKRGDRKRIMTYVQRHIDRVEEEGFRFPSYRSRDCLCPACATPAPPKARSCEACGERFINPWVPASLGFFLPGFGHMYIGEYTIGVLELIPDLALCALAFTALLTGGPAAAAPFAVMYFVYGGWDAMVTGHYASRGLRLRSDAWKTFAPKKSKRPPRPRPATPEFAEHRVAA